MLARYTYYQRQRREQREQLAIAWVTASLSRAKRLPKLEVLLKPFDEPRSKPDVEELRRRAEEVKARLGVVAHPVRKPASKKKRNHGR